MDIEPFLKDRYRAGGEGRRRDEGGELGKDSVSVSFGPVRRQVRGAEFG